MGKGKIYVVYEGRNPGLYAEWKDAFAQVNKWSNNHHEAFNTLAEAEYAYEAHCKTVGRPFVKTTSTSSTYIGESSHTCNTTQPPTTLTSLVYTNLAEETEASDIVLQTSIQRQLEAVCSRMRIFQQVEYKLHEVKVDNGLQLLRYHGCLSCSFLPSPIVSVGRFAKTEYDAKEDVAVLIMHRLLNATSRRIRDYNYYNVQMLSAELQKSLDENFTLKMEIAALKAEIEFQNTSL